MPYVMTKKDGKSPGSLGNMLWTESDLEMLRGDGHSYTFVNTTTRRVKRVGPTLRRAARMAPRCPHCKLRHVHHDRCGHR
jgi:hypothetical protein